MYRTKQADLLTYFIVNQKKNLCPKGKKQNVTNIYTKEQLTTMIRVFPKKTK
jgi:hypothetical protein